MNANHTTAARDRAVVIGASMAGLLAARVLADHFAEVVLVDRDRMPTAMEVRRGVPQGRHVHVLLGRGEEILRELFGGIHEDFLAAGATTALSNRQIRFVSEHGVLPRLDVGEPLLCASRPLIEHVVRQRVLALPPGRVREATDVTGVLTDDTGRVTGLRIFPHDAGAESWLPADLVVDASGRSGRTTGWLEALGHGRGALGHGRGALGHGRGALGYGRPAEDVIHTRLAYVTRRYRLGGDVDGDRMILVAPRPELPFGLAAAVVVEGGEWLVTLFGYGRWRPSADPGEFLTQAERVAPPELMAALRAAPPASEVRTHQMPTSLRRRYEKLRRFPAGLLVFGDAICSFNPIYGQGMTVAAQESLVLADWLRDGRDDPRRFFREVAKVIQPAWDMVCGGDLSLPEVPGPRPPPVRVIGRYMRRLQAAAVADERVAVPYMKVLAMLERPSALFRPAMVARCSGTGAPARRPRGVSPYRWPSPPAEPAWRGAGNGRRAGCSGSRPFVSCGAWPVGGAAMVLRGPPQVHLIPGPPPKVRGGLVRLRESFPGCLPEVKRSSRTLSPA